MKTSIHSKNLAVNVMWKNIVEQDRSRMKIWRMRIACWIRRATNTHSGCVILTDFPLQQWLHERASMLRFHTLPILFECKIHIVMCLGGWARC